MLARRFVRRYRQLAPTADLGDVYWYAGLHAARLLIDLAGWQRTGDPRAEHHPWDSSPRSHQRTTPRHGRARRAPIAGHRLGPVDALRDPAGIYAFDRIEIVPFWWTATPATLAVRAGPLAVDLQAMAGGAFPCRGRGGSRASWVTRLVA